MSRPGVLSGYHHYAQSQSPFGGHGHSHGVVPSPMFRLPMRAPEMPPASYHHPHHQQHAHHAHAHAGHHNHGRTSNLRMSDPAYASPDELAQMQQLSGEYEPEATGPLVGERQSSAAITTEYANADPVYRVKTAALPNKYAYFRTCRGDGHCGWRAIAFTYYESLLRTGDINKFEDEEVRLKSMVNLYKMAGFDADIVNDFADSVFDLMRQLTNSLQNMDGAAADILLQAFNDYSSSMAIITYFKCLASAWIQSHPNDYIPFVLDFPDLKSYCEANIDRANCEIDHVAINALGEVLVKPAGLRLEILYLDRSPGEAINNTWTVEPTGYDGLPMVNAPTMRLLYRPGHYDILYKAEDFPPPVHSQAPIHVALASYADEFVPMSSSMSSSMADVMTLIPGMYPTSIGQRWPEVSYDYEPNPAPQPHVTPVPSYAPAPTSSAPVASSHREYIAPVHASHVSHHNPPSHHSIRLEPHTMTLPIHPPPPMTLERGLPMAIEKGGPFRPSNYNLSSVFGGASQPQSVPFSTSIFYNSPYNKSHFLNEDFQPEEWSPNSDKSGNRGRHRSGGN